MAGEEEIFFWIDRQLAVLAVPAGYTDCKKRQSCGFINMDRCDTHTHRTIIWPLLPSRERDRIISAFHVKSALVKMQKLH